MSAASGEIGPAKEIVLSLEPPTGSARNRFRGVVTERATLGALTRVTKNGAVSLQKYPMKFVVAKG